MISSFLTMQSVYFTAPANWAILYFSVFKRWKGTCSWCNYCQRQWAWQLEFKSRTSLFISFIVLIPLRKSDLINYSPFSYRVVIVGQRRLFNFGMAKENCIHICKSDWKIDMSYSAYAKGLIFKKKKKK